MHGIRELCRRENVPPDLGFEPAVVSCLDSRQGQMTGDTEQSIKETSIISANNTNLACAPKNRCSLL